MDFSTPPRKVLLVGEREEKTPCMRITTIALAMRRGRVFQKQVFFSLKRLNKKRIAKPSRKAKMAPREKVRKRVAEKKSESRKSDLFEKGNERSGVGFAQKKSAVKVGAKRRFPINCGSMAKPEGWGNPNM